MFQKKINKKIAEYQNEIISKHFNEIENIYSQMRGWKHDYHNHLQVMKAYIALGQVEELGDYCDKLEQDLKSVDKVIKTGNIMLDAILNCKLSLAKSRDIEVNAKATVPKELPITDIDLCVLIGNLLDNSLEACNINQTTKKHEYNNPFIRIFIGMKGTHLYICITNTVYGKVNKKGGRFLSSKGNDSHGFGLIRIDKICEKYGGYCSRGSEPGAFSSEILLPVGKK